MIATVVLILALIAFLWLASAAIHLWPILTAFYLLCAAIGLVAILASCVKAAEADARLREDDER